MDLPRKLENIEELSCPRSPNIKNNLGNNAPPQ